MKNKPNQYLYILALAGLIVAGVITTSIINAVKSNNSGTDVRARAGTLNTLKFVGTVASVNEADGTFTVDNVQFSSESRSGKAVNYGTWTVTPPRTFSIGSATPGRTVTFTVSTKTFDVASKQVAAVQVSVSR